MQLKGKGMQLKVKDMQLKVGMQKNIGERGSRRDICSLSSSLVFLYSVLLTSSCESRKKSFLATILLPVPLGEHLR